MSKSAADRRLHPLQLSLWQLGKIVLACAVACAFITPIYRAYQVEALGLVDLILVIATSVPLVWILLCFVLMVRSAGRELLISLLLLIPVSLWAVCITRFALPQARWAIYQWTTVNLRSMVRPPSFSPAEMTSLRTACVALAIFSVVEVFLLGRVIRLMGEWLGFKKSSPTSSTRLEG